MTGHRLKSSLSSLAWRPAALALSAVLLVAPGAGARPSLKAVAEAAQAERPPEAASPAPRAARRAQAARRPAARVGGNPVATAGRRVGGVWRPNWWPSWLPAGSGRAGVVIRLSQQRLYVHDGRRGWTHFPVATGAYNATPRGTFRIVSKVRQPSWSYRGRFVPGGVPANPLGVCWMGLSMPRAWRGAPIGIHGTNAPWLIGQPVSRGCIRMYNRDALKLFGLVPHGTPVYIISAAPAGSMA